MGKVTNLGIWWFKVIILAGKSSCRGQSNSFMAHFFVGKVIFGGHGGQGRGQR